MLKFLTIIFFILPAIRAGGEFRYTNHFSTQPSDSLDIKRHALISKAQSSYNAREFEMAIRYAERGLLKLDSVREADLAVYTCNLLGSAYTKVRSFDRALSRLNTALRLSQRLHKDHYLIGDCHFHLGVYHDVMGNREETVRQHTIALERRMALFGPDHLKVAESYNGLGEAYTFIFFDYRKAIVFYEKSVRIREKHLPPDAHELYAGYYNLSQSYRMLEDGDKALSYAFKALTVVNSKREYVSLLEKCYLLLGNIYAGRLEFGPALDYFKKAMQQSVSIAGADNYNLILSYTSLGLAYGEMGQLQKAIKSFKRSLDIYSLHKATNPGLLASNFLHLGRMFQKMREYDSAKYYLKRNLDVRLAGSGPTNKRTSDAYSYLAKFYQQFGQMDTAAFYIQKALIAGAGNFDDSNIHANPILDQTIKSYELFELFGDKGSILLDYYNEDGDVRLLSSAMASFKISDALMELNRRAYHQDGSKLFFADHYHHIYENALHAAFLLYDKTKDANYFADALTFMEKCKAILLAESLNKAEIFSSAGLPDSLREMERNLNTALATYRSQLESVPQQANSEAIQQRIQSRIFDISQKQEKLLDTIARLYPNYYQIKYQELSSLSEIRNFADKNNSTIIEYFWGEENIYVLGISDKKLTFREITGVDSLTRSVMKYFQTLQQVPSLSEQKNSFETFITHAFAIYDGLLAPVIENNADENLVIIRDGPLLLVPFESLPVSKSIVFPGDYQHVDYLIRRHNVSYAHSADLLLKNYSRIRSNSAESKILAFSYSQLNPSSDVSANRSINELPGAAREIQAISEILPGSFFLGDEATEQKFKSFAGDYDILHLAVHGKSDPEKQFSGSLFFKQSQDKQEDGELHVYELYDLSLKARLAVLSACESGVGKFFRGEGVFSIARGFAYAGCPATVMTLWPISDIYSATIMADFYRELNDGENIDVALRTAKLNYLENTDPQLAHPAYWAAFIPTGNMEAVIVPRFSSGIRWTLITVAFIFFAWFVFKNRYCKRPQTHHPKQRV